MNIFYLSFQQIRYGKREMQKGIEKENSTREDRSENRLKIRNSS